MLSSKTKQQITTIRSKVKGSITGTPEFSNDDAVIEYAIETLFNELKKKKVL
jgi:hypothetical protein